MKRFMKSLRSGMESVASARARTSWICSVESLSRGAKKMLDVILKRFEQADEIRTFEKGKFELVSRGGMTIGRATYEPGWRWSVHVGAGRERNRAWWSTWEW